MWCSRKEHFFPTNEVVDWINHKNCGAFQIVLRANEKSSKKTLVIWHACLRVCHFFCFHLALSRVSFLATVWKFNNFFYHTRGGTSWDFFGSWADELSWPLSNGELSWAFTDFEFGELSWAELFQIFNLASRAELSCQLGSARWRAMSWAIARSTSTFQWRKVRVKAESKALV